MTHMKAFIEKWYIYIVGGLIAVIACLSYTIGSIHGAQVAQNKVRLECDSDVLKTLTLKPVSIDTKAKEDVSKDNSSDTKGLYLGSKNGTKFYTPGCPSAKRIKPENIIWFQSSQDAELQGYSQGSC